MSAAVASAPATTTTKTVNNATSSATNNNNRNNNLTKTTAKSSTTSGDTTSKAANKINNNNNQKTGYSSSGGGGGNDTNDSKQQRLKYIANVVRALVTSRKPPCKLREVLREYPDIEGEPLNFRKLGYPTAKDLLKATGEFSFTQYGEETYINAAPSSKSAHISSMVRQQKASKSTRIKVAPQVRQPKRSDQSWNKSSYSSNVFQRLRTTGQQQQQRWRSNATVAAAVGTGVGDRNNNNSQQQNNNSRNNIGAVGLQTQQKEKEKEKTQLQKQTQPQTQQKAQQQPQQQQQLQPQKTQQQQKQPAQQQQTPLQRQKSVGSTNKPAVGSEKKDLREMLNAKAAQQQSNGGGAANNGNKMPAGQPDLRERLNAKRQPQQQQSLPTQPRPILGQNNNSAIAIASTLILAQREQKIQEQHQQQRAQLLAAQQLRQQQQQQKQQLIQQNLLKQQELQMQAKQKLQAQQQLEVQQQMQAQQQLEAQQQLQAQQQQMQAQQRQMQAQKQQLPARQVMSGGGIAQSGVGIGSVQDRLRIRINNNHNGNDFAASSSTGSNTPETSPALSSAGSDKLTTPSPFVGSAAMQQLQQQQQPLFHKQRYIVKQQQLQQQQQQQQFGEANGQNVIPPRVFQFNPKLDPITSLTQYCVVRRYAPPAFSAIRSKFSRLYQCRVNVNGTIFSTYPNEYLHEHLAQISCAQKAIELLKLQEARRPLPLFSEGDADLIDKLYNELHLHPHGIFAKNIPEMFEEAYQQALPEHWWTLVQTSPRFTTESATNNAVIVFANEEADKDKAGATGEIIQMDGIALPWKQKYWQLYITYCASTVDVWARLFGKEYSERFDAVMSEIDTHMATQKTRPLSLACKNIYLVCINECWHRVRVEELDKPNATARCFFIDYGDSDWVAVSELYICEAQFLRLPAQAVPLSLFGLEDFAGNPNARRHLDTMLSSKSVVGEILTKESDFYNTESSACGKIQVVLYDTSTEEDVNLNPLLLSQICDDTPPPEIKHKGATNVLVSHVSEDGDLYLQILNSDFKYVQKLIQQLIESKFKREQHKISASDLKRSNLFLICDDTNGSETQWYRGALTDMPSYSAEDEEFDIFYVDHGITRRTHISKIFRLESLSTALSKFPRQAIRARLHNIPPITKSIVGRMRALLPANCATFVKMNKPGKLPYVTVYRRHESSDMLCNINEDIRMEAELECSTASNGEDDDVPVNGKHYGLAKNASGGSLNSPTTQQTFVEMTRGLTITTSVPNSPQKVAELPKLQNYDAIPRDPNDFLEVRVTMSANPSNFTIQPYKDYPRLRDLMKELQEYCENNDEFIPADMVEIGQAYAAKNPDGFYHRVVVVNTYNGDMIHVCFCDFGDIAILRSDQLKILPAKYRQLRKMSIQAKLHGITATHGDWSLEDCLRFRQLTVGQKFVASIKRITYDKLGSPDTPILELELIDVTTDEDVYIHEILLKEQRAIKNGEVKSN
ncbi:uncharacterized protein LOC118744646 isoform X2 [Rhagoletis pomonella]|uniref:uncharacterized protein LOC118744646 isoform X2 n=1 Tax=Rhagoletis pomonella TaxID=28610 RepID=UPI00177DBB0B|nr:uncharacterized protein LOC118744646 isoform X2 [Rhagoletis pomonella]